MSSQELSDHGHVTAPIFPHGGVARVCKPGGPYVIQESSDSTFSLHVVSIVDGKYGNIDLLRTAGYRPIGGGGGGSSWKR